MIIIRSFLFLTVLFISTSSFASWKTTPQQYSKIQGDLIAFESVRYCPYLGVNGVITIGVGTTMGLREQVTENGKTFYKTKVWSLKKINSMFRKAGVKQMTSSQYKQIVKLRDYANSKLKKGQSGFYKKQPRSNVYCLSKKDGDKELTKLLNYTIDKHVDAIAQQADSLKIDLNGLPDQVIELIFDLFYRGGHKLVLGSGTPTINEAIRSRDWITFFKEAYARSNKGKIRQNDVRNVYYTSLGLQVLPVKDKLLFKTFLRNNENAQEVNERISEVVNNSPESIPPAALDNVINLALRKNVFYVN